MSSEKRLILFTIVTFLSFFAIEYVLVATGLKAPEPARKKPGNAVAKADASAKAKDKAATATAPTEAAKPAKPVEKPAEPARPAVALAEPGELILGATAKSGPFHLEVQLTQKGAGVAAVRSALYEAEFLPGLPKHRPLALLTDDPLSPASMAMTLVPSRTPGAVADAAAAAGVLDAGLGEIPLDGLVWEVVRGPDGKVVQPAVRTDTAAGKPKGQMASFRTKVGSLGIILTKTYSLFEGDNAFSMDLKIESPEKDQSVVYKLLGPHGVPIEGEWYTGVFRDAVFGMIKGRSVEISTLTADSVAKRKDDPERFVGVPFKYLGVENQYFAVLLLPTPPASGVDDNPDQEAKPLVYHLGFDLRLLPNLRAVADLPAEGKNLIAVGSVNGLLHFRVFDKDGRRVIDTDESRLPDQGDLDGFRKKFEAAAASPVLPWSDRDAVIAAVTALVGHLHPLEPEPRQKADIGVELTSKAVKVGPNAPVSRSFRVFAGPKTLEALEPFGAQDVAFRKSSWIPGAVELARWVITPLLGWTYTVTQKVGALFGKGGNYGIAIILLTLVVRLAMFPLGRKSAMAAKKMQDLQPLMMEIKEKYKDDKEEQGRQTMALYRRQGVNPAAGCLPALVQMPIFVGLWQALNNSVNLRHAGFLWIDNLAAPDMLFRFPTEVPFLGQYFNLLPFGVVALMLVQTKLFSPPATTPEMEAQQKMMKYMMVFMAFMFYKVPSGLGIYFITSSTWQICERLLLPKVTTAPKPAPEDEINGGTLEKPSKPPGKIAAFIEKMMEEAKKDPTYRKLTDENTRNGNSDNDGRKRDGDGRDRDKGKPRPKPGRKR